MFLSELIAYACGVCVLVRARVCMCVCAALSCSQCCGMTGQAAHVQSGYMSSLQSTILLGYGKRTAGCVFVLVLYMQCLVMQC